MYNGSVPTTEINKKVKKVFDVVDLVLRPSYLYKITVVKSLKFHLPTPVFPLVKLVHTKFGNDIWSLRFILEM